jgi:membrane associated rhomboid family serine protease
VLILPLHRPLNRANFPRVTVLLVLVNVLVFFILQSRDHETAQLAHDYYRESGLATIEAPLYDRHLEEVGNDEQREMLAQVPAELRPLLRERWMQHDEVFRARLAAGELFEDETEFARWQPPGQSFRELRERIFTARYAFNAENPRALQLLSSMFLHGGLDHLLGNMLFLLALGLLVEGPLGAGLFSALYLTAGAGAGLAWLGWHGDGPGAVIGASGAIAGLMGAFCVLWGRRRVRFFYWFFVVFDYVRAPALVLLPLWLGWELLQMWLSAGSRVAYSAHAGGIAAGALLALAVKQARWHRESWFEEQGEQDDRANPERLYAEALTLLGRLQLGDAEALLDRALAIAPQRFELRLAHYRCARYANRSTLAEQRLQTLLELPVISASQVGELAAALAELDDTQWGRVPAPALAGFALRLATVGETAAALALLGRVQAREPQAESLPQHWLQLAFRLRDRGDQIAMRTALQRLIELHPDSPQAGKARFLLEAEQA